jgi:hypothetical protein
VTKVADIEKALGIYDARQLYAAMKTVAWAITAAGPTALAVLHESRTDLAMLCGSTFLLVAGAGARSLERCFAARPEEPEG